MLAAFRARTAAVPYRLALTSTITTEIIALTVAEARCLINTLRFAPPDIARLLRWSRLVTPTPRPSHGSATSPLETGHGTRLLH
ncbi:hypothetical protein GCM10009679_20600 [Saccharothrix algeriensis]|uniref:Uncharacterized protein n=1 Tax=Catellatospora bangladeshensis TaxID=310355 RepID=A0A8J3JNP6_9ACTN|nr:hypothetical protein Cba03nite_34170 [Catellatospora bangladeshensis]